MSNEPTASGSVVAPGALSTTSGAGLSAVETPTPSCKFILSTRITIAVSQSPVIPSISGAIRLFAIYSKSVTSTDLKLLLTLLEPFVPEFPFDLRTILKTPPNVHKTVLTSRCYVHIGIPTCLRRVYHHHRLNSGDHITMQVNIDGIPLFGYPGTELWPILCRIVHPFTSTLFVIGSCCGRGRPDPVSEYLQPFLSEMIALRSAGVTLDDLHLTIHTDIQCVICDAPARSYVMQTKSHNGYHGCDRCVQRGAYYISRRMTFPSTSSSIRTDSSFRERRQPDHHIGTTVLLQLSLDMVSDFPLDPMHLVFLGVMKRLVHIWCLSEKRSGLCLSSSMQQAAATKLDASVSHLPIDFPRKCEHLKIQLHRLIVMKENYQEARLYERRAERESEFTSTDVTYAALPAYKKRNKRKRILSSSDSDVSQSAPPPVIHVNKLFSYSPMKQLNVVNR
ncbi:uncharacterized protein DEA37_0008940 [Paragonimus westermani]|uniref:Uncharacterized protein n=1 Tax=Paragonimus westermani TaxID=34504 RepID=A0A5J4NS51_9TREM|nr:uncharacterized protein DEA37_0008940 [Paragonimus westermani]